MASYVALLRGIAPTNPNMHGAKLKAVFEDLGFTNVSPVISSGNVIFDSNSKSEALLEKKIEMALPKKLGFKSSTIIRNKNELERLWKKNPFKKDTHSPKTYLMVTFVKKDQKPKTVFPTKGKGFLTIDLKMRAIATKIDLLGPRTPEIMQRMEKAYGKEITTRTWKTVERILKKMGSAI